MDCVQSARKNAFAREKTQLKKALIISFVARVNQESNPWIEFRKTTAGSCSAIKKNTQ
jgi:hypothetical protein